MVSKFCFAVFTANPAGYYAGCQRIMCCQNIIQLATDRSYFDFFTFTFVDSLFFHYINRYVELPVSHIMFIIYHMQHIYLKCKRQ